MGLDWIVQAKEENGRTVEPGETTGERPATTSDPETVEAFRAFYDKSRQHFRDPGPEPVSPPGPGGLAAIGDILGGAARRRRRAHRRALQEWTMSRRSFEHWQRPFDELLEENIPYMRPIVPPENRDAFAAIRGAVGGFYDFRGDVLREDRNDVTAFAGEVLKMEYTDLLYLDKTPEEMLELADDLEKALAAYRASGRKQDAQSIGDVEAAIPWLRFWGSKRHSMAADF